MSQLSTKMRVYHRYLGFFLAGIMAVYALSGIILIFRETSFLKKEVHQVKNLKPQLSGEELGRELKIKGFKQERLVGDIVYFKQGTYNQATGLADYTQKEYSFLVKKMTNLHKASTKHPLFYLNVFFGVSLFFFVISSFWMFMPKTTIFKKSMYFTLAGVVLTFVLLLL
jgi:uncharacterized iron-regulated membrane protein